MAYQNEPNQGMYKINKRPKDDTMDFLIVGDELARIREQCNQGFTSLATNIEYQLNELRQQIAKEKQTQAEIKQQLNLSQQQTAEFKSESQKKTQDMKQINSFYKNKANQQQFDNLLNNIIARHKTLEQALGQANYSQNVGTMNKQWQDEIYKITQIIASAPDPSEFAAIVDEMTQRTNELNTIKLIEEGKQPYEIINDVVDKCEERHAFYAGDNMSTYKGPGQITDQNVLKNNDQWANLLGLIKDYIIANQNRLLERNERYLTELSGRITDLKSFKNILNYEVEQKEDNYGKKLRKKDIRQMKSVEMNKQTKNLQLNVKKRHKQNENNVQNTFDLNNQKENAELEAFKQDDNAWSNEFNQDTNAIVEYIV